MGGLIVKLRGPTLPKKGYEILKSLDFIEDFGISLKISRFHLRFPDFSSDFEISIDFLDSWCMAWYSIVSALRWSPY